MYDDLKLEFIDEINKLKTKIKIKELNYLKKTNCLYPEMNNALNMKRTV